MVLPAQGSQQAPVTVQEKISEIANGSIVEVKTKLKNMKRVRGRLVSVSNDGFEIQTGKGQRINNVKLSFDDGYCFVTPNPVTVTSVLCANRSPYRPSVEASFPGDTSADLS